MEDNFYYLEINSNRRNRNIYNNMCDFDIEFSQSGVRGKKDSFDSVSLNSPIENFNGSFDNLILSNDITFTTNYNLPELYIIGENLKKVIIGNVSSGKAIKENNFYTGTTMTIVTNEVDVKTYQTRVIGYEYLGNFLPDGDYVKFTISIEFDIIPPIGSTLYLENPTINLQGFSYIYVPNGEEVDNYYINMYVTNEDNGESRKIVEYNSKTKIIKSEIFDNNIEGINNFSIREDRVIYKGICNSIDNLQRVELPNNFSDEKDFFVGDFIRIKSGNNKDEIKKILSYDGVTKIINVDSNFDEEINNEEFEILIFSFDNFFYTINNYNILQKLVICEIELLNIIIPNKKIFSYNGGLPINYPYLFLELYNTSNVDNRNTIITNNPNESRAMFRIPIDDNSNEEKSSFLKLDGDGIVQTININLSLPIRFCLKHSNGEIVKYIEEDNFSPYRCDEFLQISACFGINIKEI